MRALAFLLLFLLVFMGVAAYMLQQKGLLTRETLDLYVGEQPTEDDKAMIAVEPLELAMSVQERKEELQEQAQEIEIRNERLAAQKKELDAQRAMLDQRIEKLRAEAQKLPAGEGTGYRFSLEPGSESGLPVISEEMLQLIKMYENMAPDDAAAVLDNMPVQTVAQVLLQMRGRQAAQIMAELDEDKATEVGKLLAAEDGIKKLPKPEPAAAP